MAKVPRGSAPPPGDSAPARQRPIAFVVIALLLGLFVVDQSLKLPSYVGSNQWIYKTRYQPNSHAGLENDEKIYVSLVNMLEAGRGYTLHGHPLLNSPWMATSQYDRPLFYHPPGGIALFWLLNKLTGEVGFALAELISYGMFFGSVMLLCPLIIGRRDRLTLVLVAFLAALTPIMVHSSARLWLDAPLVGFSTLSAVALVYGIARNRSWLVWGAGLLLGYASWIKLTAFFIVPGAIALAVTLCPPDGRAGAWRRCVAFVAIAAIVQVPWEVIQWYVTGTPFPVWAGRPSPELVSANPYVHYLTVVRTPWFYVTTLPQVVWTIVPSLVLLVYQWNDVSLRKKGLALLVWIGTVVVINMCLGATGYSKLLRYIILVTPATVLLFGLVVSGALGMIRVRAPRLALTSVLLFFALAGFSLEIVQGFRTALVDNEVRDFVIPLTGLDGVTR